MFNVKLQDLPSIEECQDILSTQIGTHEYYQWVVDEALKNSGQSFKSSIPIHMVELLPDTDEIEPMELQDYVDDWMLV